MNPWKVLSEAWDGGASAPPLKFTYDELRTLQELLRSAFSAAYHSADPDGKRSLDHIADKISMALGTDPQGPGDVR